MYHISESEFMQYEMAEKRLKELKKRHADELQQAYDGIHPTRTCFDYDQGSVYCESVNPVEYAIYLVELREEHEHDENWWRIRAEAYKDAFERLTDKERNCLTVHVYGDYEKRQNAWKRLHEHLEEIITTRPDLQRKYISLDEIEDMEEVDRCIDKMSMQELLEDYWDLDEQINEERLKIQSIRLYETHDMTYTQIGERLGITTARVKRYVMQHTKEGNREKNRY